MDLLTELAILVLAAFVGFEVISKVPNTLHTPLMSGTNAIHGIVVLGGLKIVAPLNLPSEMAEHASALYARNILSLIELGFDFEDEVVAGACVVREGKVVA